MPQPTCASLAENRPVVRHATRCHDFLQLAWHAEHRAVVRHATRCHDFLQLGIPCPLDSPLPPLNFGLPPHIPWHNLICRMMMIIIIHYWEWEACQHFPSPISIPRGAISMLLPFQVHFATELTVYAEVPRRSFPPEHRALPVF